MGGQAPLHSKTHTANEKSKSTGPTDLQGHDENYWRPKFDAARLAVKRAEDNHKLQDLRLNGHAVLHNGTNAPVRRAERKDKRGCGGGPGGAGLSKRRCG